MTKKSASSAIRLRGVRHNNLKNFDLDLPLGRLIVVTGVSGSGKSSLAFDTLYAEGQRRYIETFSPYARQFFDRMDKPQVDSIEGIPPAIAIEQRNSVKTTRSTVGTMTELCDYMKLLWPQISRLYCAQCGKAVRKDSPQLIWEAFCSSKREGAERCEVLVTFAVPLSEKLSLGESLALIAKQGYQRLLVEGKVIRVDEFWSAVAERSGDTALQNLTIIQDRLTVSPSTRARFVEACEQAYHFGKGKLTIHLFDAASSKITEAHKFSAHYHCAACDIEYREPATAMFSFNHPLGACEPCRGFGRVITIDYDLTIPDRAKSLAGGAVKPWQTGQGAECQRDLMKMCRQVGIPTDVPFQKLSEKWQRWVIEGEPGYGKDEEHEWPRAWYGIKGYFRWLESRSYKMHVRVLLSRYRSYTTCEVCGGTRFKPETLLYKALDENGHFLTLADLYALPIGKALDFVRYLSAKFSRKGRDPVSLALNEVLLRLGYLVEVGLGYLTLDRATRTLSGGETERVNLTTCLGTRLVNTLYVLDEPSVGLHPRDTTRLVRVLEHLRDLGNTIVVVEHEPAVMRAADEIVDLGPRSGEEGGRLVFHGPVKELLLKSHSLTGEYLSGRKQIKTPARRPVDPATLRLQIFGASRHNLKNLDVDIPLGRFVCLTGVSGSGKTTLAREVLIPALQDALNDSAKRWGETPPPSSDETDDADSALRIPHSALLTGSEHLGRVVLVDQSPLGRTPRSNPAVYTGAFDDIREIFAQSDIAQQRGLKANAFSFNSAEGQCQRCRGAGFEKVEMQFLSDVFIRCPDCNGRRYRQHILEVKMPVAGFGVQPSAGPTSVQKPPKGGTPNWSIGDVLEATIDDVISALGLYEHTRPGRRALSALKLLQQVGLGYLRAGQPINTLSGGESQRLKLVGELAAFARSSKEDQQPTLFVFDEPTTGLHFDDVRVLIEALQQLVDNGHSVLVIEHNIELIKCADWIIDLGPEAGDEGGQIVAQGTPETIMAHPQSHTGAAMADGSRAVRVTR